MTKKSLGMANKAISWIAGMGNPLPAGAPLIENTQVGPVGIELSTHGLKVRCSTGWVWAPLHTASRGFSVWDNFEAKPSPEITYPRTRKGLVVSKE